MSPLGASATASGLIPAQTQHHISTYCSLSPAYQRALQFRATGKREARLCLEA
ncbi:hypothetical protein HETIRDRAFT_170814 [Heterobasidion irregulare TC 32-1]|uniref:Uncharacterized protein n=1 Tax=Heterobasidion irregulare (strain TC 32-1) TaxID=747525 RepID=W4KER4_HETIT|nr:uncharacterized protein HETIRDRAFT_170814 [Heterobasidion irregulare TC 32-1]ETW84318.1 hypothetical protein HETIRDRAFT_170814 [Heterobasidion irregulare TC 32-1]